MLDRRGDLLATEVVELDGGAENRLNPFAHLRSRPAWMEHLWSRADASGGDRARIGPPRKWLKQAESVALVCR